MAADQSNAFPAVVEFGPFTLDIRQRCLRRNSEIIKLPGKPFDLLVYLVMNHARVVSKDDLLKNVWSEGRGLNVVEQTVGQVRKALKTNGDDPPYIVTVTGTGYQFVAPLSFPSQEAPPTARLANGTVGNGTQGGNPPPTDHLDIGETVVPPPIANLDESKRERTTVWRSPFVFLALGLVGLAAIGVALYATAPGEPAACEVSVNTLIVKDGQGREVWRQEFTQPLYKAMYATHPPLCRYFDLDGDGVADVLFSLRPEAYDVESDKLYGFITQPRMLRRLRPIPALTFTFTPGADLVVGQPAEITGPNSEYFPPYVVVGVFPRRTTQGEAQIVVSSVMNNAPNQIAVLDGRLRKISEYWHAGHLRYGQFAKYNGQERIFLAGVDNAYRSATLVSFDPNNIAGTTDVTLDRGLKPEDRAPKFGVISFGKPGNQSPLGKGTETCRVLFERTCLAKAKLHREPYNRAIGATVTENRIIVTVVEGEREDRPENVVYELDRHLNLIEAAPTTQFRQRHLELERAGLLDHPFSMNELKSLVHVLPGCEFVEK